ncbi:major capsid protein [Pseudoalteromonas phage Cr39582]|uniref:Major capsid protein n=1 Tax=Pseudoalteromonas phage Cr39582 TaxID=2099852 RepID=A0A2P1CLD7_9VIRU|nr:major head protein [Pseudoalteromonas phage Cr39582]AVJ51875.1 major capsid protein [Pseudoalteromonas phage Cr39582]
MRSFLNLNSIPNVAAGNSCSIKLPIGQTYEVIDLKYSGVTPSQIKNVRVELDGRLLSVYKTLNDLILENTRHKRKVKAGVVSFHFVRPEMKGINVTDLVQQRMFALGTVGLTTCEIKFDIDEAAADPKLSAIAQKSVGTAPSWLTMRRTFYKQLNNGTTEVADLPPPEGYRIAAIHIKAAGVEAVEFQIDGTKWRDLLKKEDNNYILEQYNKTVLENTYTIDFMLEGDIYQSVLLDKTIQDLRLKIDSTMDEQAEIVVEYMGVWSRNGF